MEHLTKTETELVAYLNKAVMRRDGIAALSFLTYQIHNPPLGIDFDRVRSAWFKNSEDLFEGLMELRKTIDRLVKSNDPRISMYGSFCYDQYQILSDYLNVEEYKKIGLIVREFVDNVSDRALKWLTLSFLREPKGRIAEFGTPESVCALASKILDVKNDETVADLCSGRGDFLSQYASPNTYGFEINSDLVSKSIGICALNGSFPLFRQQDVLTIASGKYDKVFCEFPWGYCYERPIQALDCENWKPLPVRALRRSMMSWLFIAKALSVVDEKGIAVIHANDGALFSTYESDVRKEAVEKGLLKAVISLPNNIMENTGVASSLLVFSRGNSSVRFIDASKFGTLNNNRRTSLSSFDIDRIVGEMNREEKNELAVSISNAEIIAHNGSLSPKTYLNPKSKIVSIINGKTLGDLGTEIIRGVVLNSRFVVKEAVSEYRVLSSADIVDGRVDVGTLPYLTQEGIEQMTQKALLSVLRDGDVVMTNKSTVIKTAVVETKGEKILLFGSLYGLRIDSDLMNPDYLCCFMNSTAGQYSLRSIQTGTIISMITVANLKSFMVPCPSILEQNYCATRFAITLEMIQDSKEKIIKMQKEIAGSFDYLLAEGE